jgi:tetratricopeptide (TPR) repeat protein
MGDISRTLRRRFGKETHITGDLLQTEQGGLSLTVRGDGIPSKSFDGSEHDLEVLVAQAAEYLYGRAEPSRYATYLESKARWADVIAFSRSAYASDSKSDQPYLLNAWAIALGFMDRPKSALLLLRQALKQAPTYWTPYNNIMSFDIALGDEEGAWRTGEDLRRAAGVRPRAVRELLYQNWDALTWNLQAWRDALIADAESHAGVGTGIAAANPRIADIDLRQHDIAGAEFQLQIESTGATSKASQALAMLVRARLEFERGELQQAAKDADEFLTAYSSPEVAANYGGANCWAGPLEEAAGNSAKADVLLNENSLFVDCLRLRGDVLDKRGKWPEAQQAYMRAIAIAPDLPASYYSWGLALMRHAELPEARAKLEVATKRGPHWADPIAALGDLDARAGRSAIALREYKAALALAPNWEELKQKIDHLVR